MTRAPDHDKALELLKAAIAALGEHIAAGGAFRLPAKPERRAVVLQGLGQLGSDVQILADACAVLLRRPDLLA